MRGPGASERRKVGFRPTLIQGMTRFSSCAGYSRVNFKYALVARPQSMMSILGGAGCRLAQSQGFAVIEELRATQQVLEKLLALSRIQGAGFRMSPAIRTTQMRAQLLNSPPKAF